MMPDHDSKIGNEISSRASPLLDLRTAQASAAVAKPKPTFLRKVRPPLPVSLHLVDTIKTSKKAFLGGLAFDLLFIAIAAFASVLSPHGGWLFVAYVVISVTFKLSSQRIFRSALLCLVLIPCLLLLHRQSLANVFALLTFYFLAIGVLRAIIELRYSVRYLTE